MAVAPPAATRAEKQVNQITKVLLLLRGPSPKKDVQMTKSNVHCIYSCLLLNCCSVSVKPIHNKMLLLHLYPTISFLIIYSLRDNHNQCIHLSACTCRYFIYIKAMITSLDRAGHSLGPLPWEAVFPTHQEQLYILCGQQLPIICLKFLIVKLRS